MAAAHELHPIDISQELADPRSIRGDVLAQAQLSLEGLSQASLRDPEDYWLNKVLLLYESPTFGVRGRGRLRDVEAFRAYHTRVCEGIGRREDERSVDFVITGLNYLLSGIEHSTNETAREEYSGLANELLTSDNFSWARQQLFEEWVKEPDRYLRAVTLVTNHQDYGYLGKHSIMEAMNNFQADFMDYLSQQGTETQMGACLALYQGYIAQIEDLDVGYKPTIEYYKLRLQNLAKDGRFGNGWAALNLRRLEQDGYSLDRWVELVKSEKCGAGAEFDISDVLQIELRGLVAAAGNQDTVTQKDFLEIVSKKILDGVDDPDDLAVNKYLTGEYAELFKRSSALWGEQNGMAAISLERAQNPKQAFEDYVERTNDPCYGIRTKSSLVSTFVLELIYMYQAARTLGPEIQRAVIESGQEVLVDAIKDSDRPKLCDLYATECEKLYDEDGYLKEGLAHAAENWAKNPKDVFQRVIELFKDEKVGPDARHSLVQVLTSQVDEILKIAKARQPKQQHAVWEEGYAFLVAASDTDLDQAVQIALGELYEKVATELAEGVARVEVASMTKG
ncbi:hypothetical protein ACFLZ1_03230 [Patescibacteria group bacterium]